MEFKSSVKKYVCRTIQRVEMTIMYCALMLPKPKEWQNLYMQIACATSSKANT